MEIIIKRELEVGMFEPSSKATILEPERVTFTLVQSSEEATIPLHSNTLPYSISWQLSYAGPLSDM